MAGHVYYPDAVNVTGWQDVVTYGYYLMEYNEDTPPYPHKQIYVAFRTPNVAVTVFNDFSVGVDDARMLAACDTSFSYSYVVLRDNALDQYSGGTIQVDNLSIGRPSSVIIGASHHVQNQVVYMDAYPTRQEAINALNTNQPITYRLTNCTAPGAPSEAAHGSSVSVVLTPNSGYSFINPSSDIYVTNNGVAVVSSYANGVLHFTMP